MFSKYPDVVSIKELTSMLNIGKSTAYELLKSEELKSIKIGKQYRILMQFVSEYLVEIEISLTICYDKKIPVGSVCQTRRKN